MKKTINIFFLLITIFSSHLFAQTTYYLDSTNGSDSNDGTSPSTAWQTIAKINNSWNLILTGDNIMFKKGEVFSGTRLDIKKGGTVSNPFIIGSYGTGDRPVITSSSGGIRCWDKDLNYIQIQDIALKDISGNQAISIRSNGRHHITISHCLIDNVAHPYNGILIDKVDTYIIENCIISNCYNCGIAVLGGFPQISNGIIRNNTVFNITGNDGITIHKNGDYEDVGPNHQVLNNICFNCAEQGIDITSGTQIIVRNNETYNNGDSGVLIDHNPDDVWVDKHYSHDELQMGIIIADSNNTKLTNSIIFNAGYHSITMGDSMGNGDPCVNVEVYNNTIVHTNTASIIDIYSGLQNLFFKNNIIISLQTSKPDIYVRYLQSITPDNTNANFDFNIWWRPDGYSRLWYDPVGGAYDFNTWRSNYNQDSSSLMMDPMLKNPSNGDFHLQSISQATNSATDVGLSTDFEGTQIPQFNAPDIGAYEYTPPAPLQADLNGSPSSGYAPLSVNFTASASGGTSLYTYSWDFGDGSSSTLQNPSHTYSQSGNFTAKLTVIDNQDTEESELTTISVTMEGEH